MNSKTTGVWFVIAAALLAFIFVFEHYFRPVVAGPAPLLPNLRPAAVTSLQVLPAGALEIIAGRTNDSWFLTKPVAYPAQTAAIEALLDSLQKLAPAKISAEELREHTNADAEFGFDAPQARFVIVAGSQSWRVSVGKRTAPGDQVYLRVDGVDGAFVADADWLKFLPRSGDEWRDTALVITRQNDFDWIVLTNNAKGIAIELRRDPTNHLWHMIRPSPVRADTDRITGALQRLAGATVTRFVTDDPRADLTAFGLQPPDLDLWLGRGTNLLAAVHAGKSPTNDPTQVYAKVEGWNTVVLTAGEPLAPWRAAANDFRDTRLLELTAPVAEIEVRGGNNFILREQGTNDWSIVGEKYPADAGNIQQFINSLASLRVAEFVKEVATKTDWADHGLATPQREIILRSKAGDTNAVIARLSFGAARTNEVFAQCAGEDSIYAVTLADFNQLPEAAWEFRDRRIWNFKTADVTRITIHQAGKIRQIIHNGPDKWSLAAGSNGILDDKGIGQAVDQFGELAAAGSDWVGCNLSGLEQFGFGTNQLQITFELKNGDKDTVDFGGEFRQRQTGLGAVTLDGDRWVFLFSPVAYQLALSYLTIPANVP